VAGGARGWADPGALDRSFGSGGTRNTNFQDQSFASDETLTKDGHIMVAVTMGDDFGVTRYLPNGSLDHTFSNDGKVRVDLGGPASVGGVAVTRTGRVVVGGSFNNDFAFVRLLRDGALDTSFGDDGIATLDLGGGEAAYAIALDESGRIVAVGQSGSQFAVARLLRNGKPDLSFGGTGYVNVMIPGSFARAKAVAFTKDLDIIVAGETCDKDECQPNQFIARLHADGSLDMSFGKGGWSIPNLPQYSGLCYGCDVSLGVSPKGRFYVVSFGQLAAYTPGGRLARAFSGNGGVQPRVDTGNNGIAVQSNGDIIVAGTKCTTPGGPCEGGFALERFLPGGRVDGSFGHGGIAAIDFGIRGTDVVLQKGKAVEAGDTKRGIGLARFQ
jgi:uncharacterized delta-60 repeat protein